MDLFLAIKQHDADAVARLIRDDADPNTVSGSAPLWRPLHAAIEELEHGGPIDSLVLLLRSGANPDAWDGNRDATPLLMAGFRQQREATRLLLAAGANPDVAGSEGDTPLLTWVARGDREIAALLLRSGAPVDKPGGTDVDGMTALGTAARRLDVPMIQLLRTHGADPQAMDADNLTARQRLPQPEPGSSAAWDAAAQLLA